MASELLFITPDELTKTTILGGNVDVDKYTFSILNVQLKVIEPLLGSELYDKLVADIDADTLAGDYKVLYDEFVKPITKNESIAEYIEVANVMLTNGGLSKHTADNSEIPDKDEVYTLSNKYHALAQMYVSRFYKWICKHPIEEYRCSEDEVSPNMGMGLVAGWKL